MTLSMENKIKAMCWDMPQKVRAETISRIALDPATAFSDEQILARALNTLAWYDLMELLGPQRLSELLSDKVIAKLYPRSRITYYKNARRLLSKYFISPAG
jgi:hypothetical protein